MTKLPIIAQMLALPLALFFEVFRLFKFVNKIPTLELSPINQGLGMCFDIGHREKLKQFWYQIYNNCVKIIILETFVERGPPWPWGGIQSIWGIGEEWTVGNQQISINRPGYKCLLMLHYTRGSSHHSATKMLLGGSEAFILLTNALSPP